MPDQNTQADKRAWWHVDPHTGRRIGWMTPERFDAILSGFYGTPKWIKHFAADYDVAPASVYRWINGAVPIKKEWAMLALVMLDRKHPDRMPRLKADWLPDPQEQIAPQTDAA